MVFEVAKIMSEAIGEVREMREGMRRLKAKVVHLLRTIELELGRRGGDQQ